MHAISLHLPLLFSHLLPPSLTSKRFAERHPRWLHVLEPVKGESEEEAQGGTQGAASGGLVTAEEVQASLEQHTKLVAQFMGQKADLRR